MRTVAMQQLITKLSKSKKNGKEAGFSLIELLVVVLIIGILAAIAIPVFLAQQELAKVSAVQSDLTTAKVALVSCAASGVVFATCFDNTSTVVGDDMAKWGYSKSAEANIVTNVGAASFDDFCLTSKVTTDVAASSTTIRFIGPTGGVAASQAVACP